MRQVQHNLDIAECKLESNEKAAEQTQARLRSGEEAYEQLQEALKEMSLHCTQLEVEKEELSVARIRAQNETQKRDDQIKRDAREREKIKDDLKKIEKALLEKDRQLQMAVIELDAMKTVHGDKTRKRIFDKGSNNKTLTKLIKKKKKKINSQNSQNNDNNNNEEDEYEYVEIPVNEDRDVSKTEYYFDKDYSQFPDDQYDFHYQYSGSTGFDHSIQERIEQNGSDSDHKRRNRMNKIQDRTARERLLEKQVNDLEGEARTRREQLAQAQEESLALNRACDRLSNVLHIITDAIVNGVKDIGEKENNKENPRFNGQISTLDILMATLNDDQRLRNVGQFNQKSGQGINNLKNDSSAQDASRRGVSPSLGNPIQSQFTAVSPYSLANRALYQSPSSNLGTSLTANVTPSTQTEIISVSVLLGRIQRVLAGGPLSRAVIELGRLQHKSNELNNALHTAEKVRQQVEEQCLHLQDALDHKEHKLQIIIKAFSELEAHAKELRRFSTQMQERWIARTRLNGDIGSDQFLSSSQSVSSFGNSSVTPITTNILTKQRIESGKVEFADNDQTQ
ncbi:MAG: hypothetical protein EZS28_018017 [Streblomastix strix]|uniref:Uncharacterized protein n=1 Tax=Streblomastix strix TaxID=222440 RepID=A0A5J4VUX7_9EUKA|nr:MAG: hypothetical protein EZS28_018017 [Streblomastix strix]